MIRLFGKKKEQETIKNSEVETLSHEGLKKDKNKDGIPDYLQRENYASIINSNKDFLKWESDVEVEIEQIIRGLQGFDLDVEKGVWVPVSPPRLNEAGINFIKSHIRAIVNKHAINTDLTLDDAHNICLDHSEALVKNLKYRKNIYNVALADLSSIVTEVDNFMYIILSRSIQDKQRTHNTGRLKMSYDSRNMEGGV